MFFYIQINPSSLLTLYSVILHYKELDVNSLFGFFIHIFKKQKEYEEMRLTFP